MHLVSPAILVARPKKKASSRGGRPRIVVRFPHHLRDVHTRARSAPLAVLWSKHLSLEDATAVARIAHARQKRAADLRMGISSGKRKSATDSEDEGDEDEDDDEEEDEDGDEAKRDEDDEEEDSDSSAGEVVAVEAIDLAQPWRWEKAADTKGSLSAADSPVHGLTVLNNVVEVDVSRCGA